jgi:hypothetical protein
MTGAPRPAEANAKLGATVFVAVLVVGLGFAAYTRHVWEDYWITFRASRNLATGHGLVFTPGERLHTFTSPLGVLLPVGLSWLTGSTSDELPLWLFRVVGIAACGAGVVLLLRVTLTLQRHRISTVLSRAAVSRDLTLPRAGRSGCVRAAASGARSHLVGPSPTTGSSIRDPASDTPAGADKRDNGGICPSPLPPVCPARYQLATRPERVSDR